MDESKGHSKVPAAGADTGSGSPVKGGNEGRNSNPNLDQVNSYKADVSIDSTQETGWEVIARKSRNRAGAANEKPWGPSDTAANSHGKSEGLPQKGWDSESGVGKGPGNNWGQAMDSHKSAGRLNPRPQQPNRNSESAYMAPSTVIPPLLKDGWQWASKGGFSGSQPVTEIFVGGSSSESDSHEPRDVSDDDDDELTGDSDDYDSDASQKSHETRKKNRWLKTLFEALDSLTVEQINEQSRQWHCPACHDGPGAIGWYKGMQSLMTHAKTKGTTRVWLHRELAKLLEEELRRRGATVAPVREALGKWKGLHETTTDHEIVWPPMVVIVNTELEKDEDDKWLGMGNQELVEYFHTYAAVKARHSYGSLGHRGMSVLIFEATAMGYLEAERLHKQFADEGRDRDAWECRRVLFGPGGKRQLYGYLANKEDMNIFNQHSTGRTFLKFEMKSYQEMVVGQMRQINEEHQQLIWLRKRDFKWAQYTKALEESFEVVCQKLRDNSQETGILRLRTKIQHEEDREEMDYQERFFKEQMDKIQKATKEKEQEFEKLLQEERAKVEQLDINSGIDDFCKQRKEEMAKYINSQEKGVKEFEAKREKLIQIHEEKKVALKRKHLEEEVGVEKEFHNALTKLMEQYTSSTFVASSCLEERLR